VRSFRTTIYLAERSTEYPCSGGIITPSVSRVKTRVDVAKFPAYDPLLLFAQPATLFATTAFTRSSITSVRVRYRATLAREEPVGSLVDTSRMNRHRQSKSRRDSRSMDIADQVDHETHEDQAAEMVDRARTGCNRDQTKVMVTSGIATDPDRETQQQRASKVLPDRSRH